MITPSSFGHFSHPRANLEAVDQSPLIDLRDINDRCHTLHFRLTGGGRRARGGIVLCASGIVQEDPVSFLCPTSVVLHIHSEAYLFIFA